MADGRLQDNPSARTLIWWSNGSINSTLIPACEDIELNQACTTKNLCCKPRALSDTQGAIRGKWKATRFNWNAGRDKYWLLWWECGQSFWNYLSMMLHRFESQVLFTVVDTMHERERGKGLLWNPFCYCRTGLLSTPVWPIITAPLSFRHRPPLLVSEWLLWAWRNSCREKWCPTKARP